MAVRQETRDNDVLSFDSVLRVTGLVLIVFSFILGLLFFFLPSACSFLGGLQFVFAFGLFLIGLGVFIAGKIMKPRAI